MPAADGTASEAILQVVVERSDEQLALIRISGELDLSTSERLDEDLEELIASSDGQKLILDLSRVLFLDSTGLRTLWAARQRAQSAGSRLFLASPSEHVMRVLKVTKLDKVFHVLQSGDVIDLA